MTPQHSRTTRVLLAGILTSLDSSGSFRSCPYRRQNQDWVCVSLRRGARIRIGCVSRSGGVSESGLGVCLAPEGWRDMDCESRKARAHKGEGLLTKHPRSLPIGIYASCKTGRLRARKRLTPLSKKLFSVFYFSTFSIFLSRTLF